MSVASELFENRRLTSAFIATDPVPVQLIPRVKVRTASGAYTWTDAAPRALQTFKLVFGGATGGGRAGLVRTGDGVERMFAFILIGNHDAVVEIGDHWLDAEGQSWEIEEILPYNGYETKATVRSYGGDPQHG